MWFQGQDIVRLRASDAVRILRIVEAVFACATRLFKDEEGWADRNGAAFCLLDNASMVIHLHCEMGAIVPEKIEKYFMFSLEKARRLAEHAFDSTGKLSSFQTRNPDKNQWGGAIAGIRFIFSMSGLPELGDEAVMLLSAVLLQEMTVAAALHVARFSNNPYFKRLLSEMDLLLQNESTRLAIMGSKDPVPVMV